MGTDVSFYHEVKLYENYFSQIISCPNLIDLSGGRGDVVRGTEGNKAHLRKNEDIFKTILTGKTLFISKLISHLT